jgi:tRNA A-37 threonylcarbamoyl transferase component Bud32/putative lipoic acid-binding regulatory protein
VLDHFSDSSIKVVQLAQLETEDLCHDIIGTEHLLLGLLAYETGTPAIILKALGITRKKAKEEVIRIMKRGAKENNSVDFTFTVRAKAVFRAAEENRERHEDGKVEPDDIMAAILSVPRCTAQKVLHALDVDTDELMLRLSSKGLNDTETGLNAITFDQLNELHHRIQAGAVPVSNDSGPQYLVDPQQQSTGQQGGNRTNTAGTDPMLGYIIDRKYEVISVLGYGGMGVVYKVNHLILGRYFAIKIIHPYLAADVQNRRRFQREAQAASRLTHPNLATVFDWDILEDGRPYIVMYYIDGVKLTDLIRVRQTVSEHSWISIFMQMCDAVAHAHANGVLHRDLKPSNVLLSKTDDASHFVKIVDFGIAKILTQNPSESKDLTKSGEVFGSPFYMSPEQCMGRTLDVRSDIYGLGVVMYECLTGSCPFLGDSLYHTMTKHVNVAPPPFSQIDPTNLISRELEAIVMRCLAKSPDDRYQSMTSVKRALIMALGATNNRPSGTFQANA